MFNNSTRDWAPADGAAAVFASVGVAALGDAARGVRAAVGDGAIEIAFGG
jgi:hypothetical protein